MDFTQNTARRELFSNACSCVRWPSRGHRLRFLHPTYVRNAPVRIVPQVRTSRISIEVCSSKSIFQKSNIGINAALSLQVLKFKRFASMANCKRKEGGRQHTLWRLRLRAAQETFARSNEQSSFYSRCAPPNSKQNNNRFSKKRTIQPCALVTW